MTQPGPLRYAVASAKNSDVAQMAGSRAAGVMLYSLIPFLVWRYIGIQLVMDILHFDTYAAKANLVLTGEGRI